MVYTPLTIKAMKIAYEAHMGQCDQSGVPYIFHPVHLAEQMTDEVTTCIALLHDVLEDTSLTIQELEKEFPEEITRAVLLLTHDPAEDYLAYVRRLCENPLARRVKIADIAHNTDETRLSSTTPDPAQLEHWRAKYAAAKEIIREYEEI
ncbi:HD domain-containing protein [Blautia sp. HCP3S3_H10_1]|uniref:HD domain-containing protein n=1 Tax=unclassified Blautia TaxID=2648079 RepID=UPI003F8DA4C7